MGLDVTGRYRYPAPAPAWLRLTEEPVIAPEAPIIDAHHHLWTEANVPYLLDEFAADLLSGHNVVASVFVQAHYGYRTDGPAHLLPVGETEKVAALADTAAQRGLPRIAEGIVAFADLMRGSAVAEVLEAHEVASGGRLRGIRHSVSRDPEFPDGIVLRPAPEAMLADPAYRDGLREVSRAGLSFDAMLYSRQIPELTALARAMPDLPIVLDHIGCVIGVGPYETRMDEQFAVWRKAMADLAQCPNVVIKIGGFGMIICGARWHEAPAPPSSSALAAAWQRWFDACVGLFGPSRCLFESNFPVDKAMYSYRTLWNAFKLLAADLSDDERHALFAGTAARAYRITDPAAALAAPARG
ncbi:MAG: amidohydrolase family protein [Pseudomonadota bacterium]